VASAGGGSTCTKAFLRSTLQYGYNQGMAKATSAPAASVGVRDLKNGLSAHLDRVKAGEEIIVTEHGRPIARLIAVGAEVDRMTALVDAGIVRPPTATTRRLPARRVRLTDGGSVDDEIADQRR
jgi:prevent-host-death family protein